MNKISNLKAKRIIKEIFKDTDYSIEYNDSVNIVTIYNNIDPNTILDEEGKVKPLAVYHTQFSFVYKEFLYKPKEYFFNYIKKMSKL